MAKITNIFRNFLPVKTVIKKELIVLKQKGTSGTEIYSGYYAEEYLNKIRGYRGAKLYDEMRRSDSQVAMLSSVVKNPIKSAKWNIEAVDDSDEEKEIAEFIKFVLFKDIINPETGKRKTFGEFVEEALSCVEFGFSVFEIVHKSIKGHSVWGDYIGLRDIGFRSQKTIERWALNEDGSINFIHQLADGDLRASAAIPGSSLIVLSMNKEGANYEGISMLRPCYGNWFRKCAYQKFMAIGIEKTAMGVPAAEMSGDFLNEDNYNDQFEALKEVMQQFAAHESQSLVMPAGIKLSDYKISFDAEKVQKAIDSEDLKMTKRFLANFMELGVGGGSGSFALGSDLSDVFLSGIEYIADMICEKVNAHIIEDVVKAKYGPRAEYPKLICRGINDKAGKELADIIAILVDRGIVRPTDRLEDFINDVYGLPQINRDEEEGGDGDDNPPDPEDKPAPPTTDNPTPLEEDVDTGLSDLIDGIYKLAEGDVSRIPPKKAQDNARMGLKLRKKYNRGGTSVGVARARDISNGSELSRSTIARMSSFNRHRKNYRPEMKEDDGGATAGTIAWLLWGGTEGIDWAMRTLEKIDKKADDLMLAEPKIGNKRPSVFISRKADEFELQMKERLIERSDKFIGRVRRELDKNSGNAQKISAIFDLKMPDAKQYRDFMESYLAQTGKETMTATLEEVGKPEKKFSAKDFDGLPKRAKDRIRKEIDLVARYQDDDFEKMVYFAVNDELDKGTSAAKIIDEINKKRDSYVSGGLVLTQATNILSKTVNGVRNDVFQDPEVFKDIESFVFVNTDPKSPICQNLAGRVFTKEEYESTPYLPPLHHNCYDKKTEVYTNDGWKLFSELNRNEKFLSLDRESGNLEWVKAIDWQKIKHEGDLYHFTNTQGSLSQCVTEDHPMIYLKRVDRGAKGKIKEWHESDVSTFISHGSEAAVYCTSQWDFPLKERLQIGEKAYNSYAFAKFMGYWLSEGHLTDYSRIIITQHNHDNKDIMVESLQKHFDIQVWNTQICIKDKNLYEWLKQFGKSYQKFIPDIILESSPLIITHFLDAYCLGDGSEYKDRPCFDGTASYRVFTTSSHKMASQLCEAIIKTGKSVSMRTHSEKGKITKHKNGEYAQNHDVYGVYELSSKTRRASVIERIPYNDYVYDVTLQRNHTLLIKRKGCISWGSNCKSVIQAQTVGKKGNKPITTKGLIPTGTDEEIDKILKSKTL